MLPQVTLMQSRAACLVAGEEEKGTLAEAATGEGADFVFLFFRIVGFVGVSVIADVVGGGAVCLPS